jgi:hypothetical protein
MVTPITTEGPGAGESPLLTAMFSEALRQQPGLDVATVNRTAGSRNADVSAAAEAGRRFLLGGHIVSTGGISILQLFAIDTASRQIVARASERVRGPQEAVSQSFSGLAVDLISHLRPPPSGEAVKPADVVARNEGFLEHCYEKELKQNPTVGGHVAVLVRLDPSRKVQAISIDPAASTWKSLSFQQCADATVQRWSLPAGPLASGSETVSRVLVELTPANRTEAALDDSGKVLLPQSPAREGRIASTRGDQAATLQFVNRTSGSVQLVWLDYKGHRRFYRTLAPQAEHAMRTYVTHPWLVLDAVGKSLAIFTPDSEKSRAVIEAPATSLDPSNESHLRSSSAKTRTTLRFVNRTGGPVDVYWLDYKGRRNLPTRVEPMDEKSFGTYLSHPWLVTDSAGRSIGAFLPQADHSVAILTAASR